MLLQPMQLREEDVRTRTKVSGAPFMRGIWRMSAMRHSKYSKQPNANSLPHVTTITYTTPPPTPP
jgi:hypothetical protein